MHTPLVTARPARCLIPFVLLCAACALAILAPAVGAEDLIIEKEEIIVRSGPAPTPGSAGSVAPGAGSSDATPLAPDQLEAIFNDDSALKLKVLDEKIELVTPYGKLVIPMAHVRQIELAARLTEDESKRITQAIGGLADEDYEKREAAAAVLAEFGEKAYSELLKVSRGEDVEAGRRAKVLLDKLRESVSADRLASSGYDVVHTAESRIAGRLTATTLKVTTVQFGELQLKLADVRSLRSGAATEPEPTDVLPDPGQLSNYANQVGKTLHFRVTGAAQQVGSLYGTGFYTTDSYLSVSAVHAGVLKAGETKVVTVKILGQTQNFVGSTQNGFTSSAYSSYSAYEIVTKKRKK